MSACFSFRLIFYSLTWRDKERKILTSKKKKMKKKTRTKKRKQKKQLLLTVGKYMCHVLTEGEFLLLSTKRNEFTVCRRINEKVTLQKLLLNCMHPCMHKE